MDLQDWLEVIAPAMAEISNSSSEWWKGIRQATDETYAQWARATPMQRLGIQPPSNPKLEEGKFTRINARAASMLMAALDPSISTEMVARRLTRSCTGLVQADDPLSTWGRTRKESGPRSKWVRRSEAINLMKPDPTILTKACPRSCKGSWRRSISPIFGRPSSETVWAWACLPPMTQWTPTISTCWRRWRLWLLAWQRFLLRRLCHPRHLRPG